MSGFEVELVGTEGVIEKLKALADHRVDVAVSAVRAGVRVFQSSARKAVKGTIKREITGWMKRTEEGAEGGAGLTKFPRRGVRGRQPHGVYLEHGTKYITANHNVARSLSSARCMRR